MNMSVENNMLHLLCQTIFSKGQLMLFHFFQVLHITYVIYNPVSEMCTNRSSNLRQLFRIISMLIS